MRGPITLALVLLSASSLSALQDPNTLCVRDGMSVRCPPNWLAQAAVLGGNVLFGGLTAGLWRVARHESFAEGFTQGALGGLVVWGGKRMAAIRLDGAGLVGREVAAVGSSVIVNAGNGVPLLSQVVLPIGPLPARLEAGGHLRVRVDALGLWVLGAGLLESRLRLDIGRSLADGVMLWVADSGRLGSQSSLGEALPWAAAINRETLEGDRGPNVRAHERVHVVQFDVVTFVFSDAIDRWALHRLPFLQPLARGVALNLGTLGYWYAQGMVASAVAWRDRPWEVEATTLAGEYQ